MTDLHPYGLSKNIWPTAGSDDGHCCQLWIYSYGRLYLFGAEVQRPLASVVIGV
jgi:hypothetical protein